MTVGRLLTLLMPAALLTTNITLGLVETETVPLLFVVFGVAYVAAQGELKHPQVLAVIAVIVAYGLVAVLAGSPDGFKIVAAGIVFMVATQFGTPATLSRGCRVGIAILFAMRILSLAIPEPFVALYTALGLRGAGTYGGTAAIVFAEPSYLATGVFALWAVGRLGIDPAKRHRLGLLDYAAMTILALSFSVWAALDLLVGALIILRRHPVRIALAGTAVVGMMAAAIAFDLAPGRLQIFVDAGMAVARSGQIVDLAMMDPSASHRLVQWYLALSAAADAPFGRFDLELTPILTSDSTFWTLPIAGGQIVVLEILGQIYANTVPLQLLVFGGIPLFALFVGVVVVAGVRLWRLRKVNDAALLILANLFFGCVGQSLLNSPFLYICIAAGLFWNESAWNRPTPAAELDADLSRYDQLQQEGRIAPDIGKPAGADRS